MFQRFRTKLIVSATFHSVILQFMITVGHHNSPEFIPELACEQALGEEEGRGGEKEFARKLSLSIPADDRRYRLLSQQNIGRSEKRGILNRLCYIV